MTFLRFIHLLVFFILVGCATNTGVKNVEPETKYNLLGTWYVKLGRTIINDNDLGEIGLGKVEAVIVNTFLDDGRYESKAKIVWSLVGKNLASVDIFQTGRWEILDKYLALKGLDTKIETNDESNNFSELIYAYLSSATSKKQNEIYEILKIDQNELILKNAESGSIMFHSREVIE